MDNSYEPGTSSGTIAYIAIVMPLAVTISCCLTCCRYYIKNENAKKIKKIRRIQQSRTLQPINEQLQYRIIGLYHDNGNSAACIAYPQSQDECQNDEDRPENSTLDSETETYLPGDIPHTQTFNPPAYEDIMNGNAAANFPFNPRTHTVVDEYNGDVSVLTDDTTSIPKVDPPAYEDII